MLRNKLFWGFAFLVVVFALVSVFFSVQLIKNRVIAEAQARVRTDLTTSRAMIQGKLNEIETVLKLAATKQIIVETCYNQAWPSQEVQNRLEIIRVNLDLDFLTLVTPEGMVRIRSTPPYLSGDYRLGRSSVMRALDGEIITSLELFSAEELEKEHSGLSEEAFIVLEETPYARPTTRSEETRGMVMFSAVPIKYSGQIVGALYGGRLVNKDTELVDYIQKTIYNSEENRMAPTGSVTIFLNDSRIATSVRLPNGNRAIGTRVSKEVADRVLDNGETWEGKAFVVRDWYLTAYEPIRNSEKRIIGMLYVGLLEKPFSSLVQETLVKYILISVIGLLFSLVFAFFLSGKISNPLHRLATAADSLNKGEFPPPVAEAGSAKETKKLITAFNDMVIALKEREDNLREANEKLEKVNLSLKELNHDYMETVGFISHELKSPLSTIMNYVFLLTEEKLGTLTEKQRKGLHIIDSNVKLLVEMVRHYLNLSRIENGVLTPVKSDVLVREEILIPLLDSHEPDLEEKRIVLENSIPETLSVYADLNMLREVFENLISNAIKYGKEEGIIRITFKNLDNSIQFHVFNSGEGIPKEKLSSLFQKFSRLDDPATRIKKGTGLGLFITKHIIDAHGGEIWVNSDPGKGVDFYFTLPKKENNTV